MTRESPGLPLLQAYFDIFQIRDERDLPLPPTSMKRISLRTSWLWFTFGKVNHMSLGRPGLVMTWFRSASIGYVLETRVVWRRW